MKTWNLTDADGSLSEVVLSALCRGPQRVTLDDEVDFILLSEEEYARLSGTPAAAAPGLEAREPEQDAAGPEPVDERKWVWEWDQETQSWALPWAKDADPAEHPGLAFLDFMQNSPLADAFREGDFTPEEWDAACRIGR